jgi:ribosomal protein L28
MQLPIVIEGEIKAFRHVSLKGIVKKTDKGYTVMINEIEQEIYLAELATKEYDLVYHTLTERYWKKTFIKRETVKPEENIFYGLEITRHSLKVVEDDGSKHNFVEILK